MDDKRWQWVIWFGDDVELSYDRFLLIFVLEALAGRLFSVFDDDKNWLGLVVKMFQK